MVYNPNNPFQNPFKALEHVQFEPDFDQTSLLYLDELHYFQVSDLVNPAKKNDLAVPDPDRVIGLHGTLGFGNPVSRAGGFNDRNVIWPIVDLQDLPPTLRTTFANPDGVGPQLYNTPFAAVTAQAEQADISPYPLPDWVGAYMFSVDEQKLLDDREAARNTARLRLPAPLGWLRKSILEDSGDVEKIVEDIHENYKGHDAVLKRVPPINVARPVTEYNLPIIDTIPAEVMIIRNAAVTLRRVGTIARTLE